MTDSTAKAWYQDGWVILFVVGVVLVIVIGWRSYSKNYDDIELSGYVDQSLPDKPSFELDVWHFHPGTLSNGRLTVISAIASEELPESRLSDIYDMIERGQSWNEQDKADRVRLIAERSAGWPSFSHRTAHHSCDAWIPNEDNAVQITVPITRFNDSEPVGIEVLVESEKTRRTLYSCEWKGNAWSKPLVRRKGW